MRLKSQIDLDSFRGWSPFIAEHALSLSLSLSLHSYNFHESFPYNEKIIFSGLVIVKYVPWHIAINFSAKRTTLAIYFDGQKRENAIVSDRDRRVLILFTIFILHELRLQAQTVS